MSMRSISGGGFVASGSFASRRARPSTSNGVRAIDRVMESTSRLCRSFWNRPWSRAILNTTKANSPPAARTTPRRSAEALSRPPEMRPTKYSTGAFRAISSTVRPSTIHGDLSSRLMSALIPTLMKNRPSNRPLNGSICASSSWRYSESASSRPARKAPRAMDTPASSISSAVPITTSSAVAVDMSCSLVWATMRNTGRSR